MPTENGHQKQKNPRDLFKSMPEFDAAMRKIVATPKSEVERREKVEKHRRKLAE